MEASCFDSLSSMADVCGRRESVSNGSNTIERSMTSIALNRKNALFPGSDAGAAHWPVIASLVETAKLNAVEPMAYLRTEIYRWAEADPRIRRPTAFDRFNA